MANPHKGEASFEADGKTYVLRYSIDAVCALEEATGKGFPALARELADPERMSVVMLRKVLWSGLLEHHPDITLKEAGELIPSAGGLVGLLPKIERALTAAFPEKANGRARPR